MKKAILTALVLLSMSMSYGQDKYDLDVKQSREVTYKATGETAKYRGQSVPVYVTKNGKLFIFATSKKTGKQYKKYITTT